ncbi:alpha/beta hydrolase [Dactylosporangium sp. AC04546]|uniref:alpha/beta fold hydrolase n=1 Tax=Dactylosporangium sp. AC04546 TaxID=2862460 RepID=UPI001EDEF06B|nr:alpha/beta hydrolase [Dactylosporangium sp. AC04546]WVK89398.1 alpha/beta hydrolase [Dactylosporangium sp. AC04546]
MIEEFDVILPDGRTLHGYDSGTGALPVVWHHGTPNIGAPPAPLFETAARLGIRWLSFDRPSYGPSTPLPGRTIATAAAFTAAVADARGVGRFAVLGHSGGGSHALACAALLPGRVTAAAAIAPVAPFDPFRRPAPSSPPGATPSRPAGRSPSSAASASPPAASSAGADSSSPPSSAVPPSPGSSAPGLTPPPSTSPAPGGSSLPGPAIAPGWFAGMASGGVAALSAAVEGREARLAFAETDEGDPSAFTDADLAMFDGPWGWFGGIVEAALAGGPDGQVDDDVAYVNPWGCDPATIRCPVLLVHGAADRMVPASHSAWLAGHIPGAELWERPGDGHISVLTAAPDALRWLAGRFD